MFEITSQSFQINMVVLVCVLRLRVKLDKSSDIQKTVK